MTSSSDHLRTGRVSRPLVAGAAALIATAVVSISGFVLAGARGDDASRTAPPETWHLPTAVNAPGTWSDAEGVDGPVAALGVAMRARPVGLRDERRSMQVFAVSAVDGSASWLRLPGFSLERWGFVGGTAVSPDGRWIGWLRLEPKSGHQRQWPSGRLAGWAVMDTTTGHVRELDDPGHPWVRPTMADLAFSGDSRYLLTSYERPGERVPPGGHGRHRFVAWDVRTGRPTVLEEPGQYWLPIIGSAPTGVVWARGREVFRADPPTGDLATVTLPHDVVDVSWGPDGSGFAYIGRPSIRSKQPWRLYAGPTLAEARDHVIDLPADTEPGQLLGWRDATHVVVGHYRRDVQVVDVLTENVEDIDLAGSGEQVNAPLLAGALWQRPLSPPATPTGTSDPRQPWRWGGGVGLVVAAGVVVWSRHRARRRRLAD